MIAAGAKLQLPASGRTIEVVRLIGEGSQGTVFEARTDDGDPVALKWYHRHTASPAQHGAIVDLVDRGAPDDRFLWPQELVHTDGIEGFGYVMALRPQRYAGLVDLLTAKVDAPFSVVCRLCIELADSFLMLHSQGLCYRDISFGNVFFEPTTGVPLICDNDNVGIDGAGPASVLGTRRFMAPEIVRREAAPSIESDLYSLAVLLFYVLMTGHPLIGRREAEFECWDERAESELFGREPVFVFDPDDHSNEPTPGLHGSVLNYWGLYPGFVRELFVQAFTRGLRDPRDGRVRESVWRSSMARLRACIVACPHCRKQNFADPVGTARTCWFCDRVLDPPAWLRIERRVVALGLDSTVLAHDLRQDRDLDTVVARVGEHPTRPGVVGLMNLTPRSWWVTTVEGERREVGQGRSVRIQEGTHIDLGAGVSGEVVSTPR